MKTDSDNEHMEKRIIILGAGPTGLGAAYRLQELGYRNWAIYEKNSFVGGLAASHVDPCGFTWDIGGHVIFSHFKYFDSLMDKLLSNDFLKHQRYCHILMQDRFIPYPFQDNIRYLPPTMLRDCLMPLLECKQTEKKPANFYEWIHHIFGKGIAKHFMLPYNRKVWATPLELMDWNWIGERVSVIDVKQVVENIIFKKDTKQWGPNSTFSFPTHGGTGGLFSAFIPYIKEHLNVGISAERVDVKKKKIMFSNGTTDVYDTIINTTPLDTLPNLLQGMQKGMVDSVKKLEHNSGLIVGVGINRPLKDQRCWLYFPEDKLPFYRVTFFSRYSPNNVPAEGQGSYLCEVNYSKYDTVSKDTIIDDVVEGLRKADFIKDDDEIISTYVMDVPHSYPIPTVGRDKILNEVQPYLEAMDIYSRGRFGAWKYETGNMDHSVMMGVEVIDRILKGKDEVTWKL